MASWPAAPFPQEVIETGYSETPPVGSIRTSMDAGPVTIRRRTIANVRQIAGTLILAMAQVSTLDTFYVTTIHDGIDCFTWADPKTGVTAIMRFVNPPTYTSIGDGMFSVALTIEILP
jgi:hypothetical protein